MKLRATLIGFTAVLMWSFLAFFTAASGKMPPFQLSAICFAIASRAGLRISTTRPGRLPIAKQM
ncbi:EamA family transporter, partial [Rhizobium ruizarguesonis]